MTKAQRFRVTFSRDERLKHITHLDLMRVWERALRRAGIPVASSQGISPRPRIALAAPLPVGVTSEAERLDVFLHERIPLARFTRDLSAQVPAGLLLLDAREVAVGAPSLQSVLRAACYQVEVADTQPIEQLQAAVHALLALDALPWEHNRGEETRRYDLRALIYAIEARPLVAGRAELRMRLCADVQGSGRPEQVVAALGISAPPLRIHRTALEIEDRSRARAAYRASGRLAD